MEIYGKLWESMEIYGIYGNLWKTMNPMESYGNLWKSVDMETMEIFGNLWKTMDPMENYGNLWNMSPLLFVFFLARHPPKFDPMPSPSPRILCKILPEKTRRPQK